MEITAQEIRAIGFNNKKVAVDYIKNNNVRRSGRDETREQYLEFLRLHRLQNDTIFQVIPAPILQTVTRIEREILKPKIAALL